MADAKKIGGKITIEGEREYTDAIKNINKSMSTMRSEMKLVNSAYADNKDSVEALTAKQGVLTKQQEEQRKKVALIADVLEKVKTKYGESAAKTQEWQTKLNYAKVELNNLDNELKKNDTALKDAKSSTDKISDTMDDFGTNVKDAKSETLGFGDVLKANLTSAVIIEGVKKLGEGMKNLAENMVDVGVETFKYADDMMTLSTQTGVSTDKLQAFSYASDLVDVSLETMTGSMAKNIRSMSSASKGSEDYANAYAELGVSVKDSNGKLRDSEEVYWDVIDALGKVSDETERDVLSMQLFGKSAQDLNPLIAQGSSGIKSLASEAENMGAVLSGDVLKSLGETSDSYDRMNQAVDAAKRKVGVEMAPVLKSAFDAISANSDKLATSFSKFAKGGLQLLIDGFTWIVENGRELISIISGIGSALIINKAVVAIEGIVKSYVALKNAIMLASAEQGIFNALMAATPTGLIAAAVVGIATAVTVYVATMDRAKDATDELHDSMDDTASKMSDLNATIESNKASYEGTKEEIEKNAISAQLLSDKLFALASKEKTSNTEKKQMTALVEQLNELYPELGLTIDNVTGKLNLQQSAVDGVIKSSKDYAIMQALSDRLKSSADEVADAMLNQESAAQDLSKANDLVEQASTEAKQAFDDYNKAANEGATDLGHYELMLGNANNKVKQAKIDQEAAKKAYEQCSDKVRETSEAYDTMSTSLDSYNKTLEGSNSSTEEFKNKVTAMRNKFIEDSNAINKKYQEMYDSAKDSLSKQIGLFDEFSEESDLSKKDLINNLQSQIDGYSNWADNINRIAKVCSKDFVDELTAMGVDSAAEVKVLASMTDKELVKYEKMWKEKMASVSKAATTQVGTSNAEILKLQKQYAKDINALYDEYKKSGITLGEAVGAGVSSGIKAYDDLIKQRMRDMAKKALGAAKAELEIKSPSRKARKEIGNQMGAGVALGISDKIQQVKDAAASLGSASLQGLNMNANRTFTSNVTIDNKGLTSAITEALTGMSFVVGEDGMARMINTMNRRATY